MGSPIRYLRSVSRNVAQTLRTRHVYRGWPDVAKAALFRFTENDFGRRFLLRKGSSRSMRLSAYDNSVRLRLANSDFLVWREIFEAGEYQTVLNMGLPPDATIFDLGGNIGLTAIYLSMHCPRCRLVTVEPDAANCELIRNNCRSLIDSGRMNLVQGFVAAADGQASIARQGHSWDFRKIEATGPERIPCYSIPTLVQQFGLDRIDLLKCDVEGTEAELFQNCADWIGRVKHMATEVHGAYKLPDLYSALKAAGWNFRVVGEQAGQVTFLSATD